MKHYIFIFITFVSFLFLFAEKDNDNPLSKEEVKLEPVEDDQTDISIIRDGEVVKTIKNIEVLSWKDDRIYIKTNDKKIDIVYPVVVTR